MAARAVADQVESACRKSHASDGARGARRGWRGRSDGNCIAFMRRAAQSPPSTKTLHHRAQIVGEEPSSPTTPHWPRTVRSAVRPPAKTSFIMRVRFRALAAALALPADQFVARQRLSVTRPNSSGSGPVLESSSSGMGYLPGIAEIEFTEWLADRRQVVVRRRYRSCPPSSARSRLPPIAGRRRSARHRRSDRAPARPPRAVAPPPA